MKSLEATGKNVKEAIKAGCTQLGCDADDVEIQVLEMGSPGLFGMFGKPAKVRLTLKKGNSSDEIEMPTLSLDSAKRKEKPKKSSKFCVKSLPTRRLRDPRRLPTPPNPSSMSSTRALAADRPAEAVRAATTPPVKPPFGRKA